MVWNQGEIFGEIGDWGILLVAKQEDGDANFSPRAFNGGIANEGNYIFDKIAGRRLGWLRGRNSNRQSAICAVFPSTRNRRRLRVQSLSVPLPTPAAFFARFLRARFEARLAIGCFGSGERRAARTA